MSPTPSPAQKKCGHPFHKLRWTANGSGHYARCGVCDLKSVVYWSSRPTVLVAENVEVKHQVQRLPDFCRWDTLAFQIPAGVDQAGFGVGGHRGGGVFQVWSRSTGEVGQGLSLPRRSAWARKLSEDVRGVRISSGLPRASEPL